MAKTTQALLEDARTTTNRQYMMAEAALSELPPSEGPVLQQLGRTHLDPWARFAARFFADWPTAPTDDYFGSLRRILEMADKRRGSAAPIPAPESVAGTLTHFYGDAVVPFLLLRLTKFPSWPRWQALGVLQYIHNFMQPGLVAPVVRLQRTSPHPPVRELATTLVHTLDPADRDLAWEAEAEFQRQVVAGKVTAFAP